MFEKGKYKNLYDKEIKAILEERGFKPILILEEPNDFLGEHKHEANHILVVVGGEMKVKTGTKDYLMKPGDEIFIKSQAEHAAYFGKSGCRYFWIEY